MIRETRRPRRSLQKIARKSGNPREARIDDNKIIFRNGFGGSHLSGNNIVKQMSQTTFMKTIEGERERSVRSG